MNTTILALLAAALSSPTAPPAPPDLRIVTSLTTYAAITREIVHLHKGEITFETAANTGTTFYIELPLE